MSERDVDRTPVRLSSAVNDRALRRLQALRNEQARATAVDDHLLYLATHDALTGLPNRTLLVERLAHALAAGRQRRHAVLFLDVDHFKVVNDRLGHGVGDELLKAIGQRLLGCLRPGDTAARFGGDEFVMLLEDVGHEDDAMLVAERIFDTLRLPFAIERRDLVVTASVGVALSTPQHTWPTELLREADVALYRAKTAGRARTVLFDASMNARAADRVDLEIELQRAIEQNALRVVYQPEVDLATGVITGMEALIRWHHPRRGPVPNAELIPLAEDTGLILPIGRWVLDQACRQARAWHDLRPRDPPLMMSVNLSARQFGQPRLVEQIAAALKKSGLPPSSLRLEITESAMMQHIESAIRTIEALRALGVRMAIDDFGTGYSSLSYLRQLPVDTLKIDRSFVRELEEEQKTVAIVQAVIALAHALGMDVIAEGIETDSQHATLRTLGCDRAQGYLFWEPQDADALTAILAAGS